VWVRDNLPDCTRPKDLWNNKQCSLLELGCPPCSSSSSSGGGNSSVTYTRHSSCCHNISGWISTAASAAPRHHGYLRGPTIGWKAEGGGSCSLLCCCEACNNWARQSTPRSMAQTGLSRHRPRHLLVCLTDFPCFMRGSTEQCCTASLPILTAPPLPQQPAALLPGCTKAPCMQAGATTNAP
jgi:hypothetical protein